MFYWKGKTKFWCKIRKTCGKFRTRLNCSGHLHFSMLLRFSHILVEVFFLFLRMCGCITISWFTVWLFKTKIGPGTMYNCKFLERRTGIRSIETIWLGSKTKNGRGLIELPTKTCDPFHFLTYYRNSHCAKFSKRNKTKYGIAAEAIQVMP